MSKEDGARPMTFSVYREDVAMLEAAARYFHRHRSEMFRVILRDWWRRQDAPLIGMLSADSGNGLNGGEGSDGRGDAAAD